MHFFERERQFETILQSELKLPSLLNRFISRLIMLLLFFDDRYCFCYFVESLVLSAIETQYRGFLEQSKLLTIVVVDVKLLLDFLHLLKVSGEIGILS